MDIEKLTLSAVREKIASGELSSFEVVSAVLEQIKKTQNLNNFLSVFEENALLEAKKSDERIKNKENIRSLEGVPLAVKDNIFIAGEKNTCASKFLRDFTPSYDAKVVALLKRAGAIIIGKTNMDEFAMGSGNENSAFGRAKNALDESKVPGGSSGGSASAVAGYQCYGALGSDTGGSIRQPASYCGVVGLKPTITAISGYGVVPLAPTLDQVGPLTRTVEDNAILFNEISKRGCKVDFNASVKGKKIAIPKEIFISGLGDEVISTVMESARLYEKMGASVTEISIPSFNLAFETYCVISCAEATASLSSFDGIRFGETAEGKTELETVINSRTQGFGDEVKRRLAFGNLVLEGENYHKYFLKACNARKKLKLDFYEAFRSYDALLTPTTPTTAYKAGNPPKSEGVANLTDIFAVHANLVGVPALSVPCGGTKDGMPTGMQLIANKDCERTLFEFGVAYEREFK